MRHKTPEELAEESAHISCKELGDYRTFDFLRNTWLAGYEAARQQTYETAYQIGYDIGYKEGLDDLENEIARPKWISVKEKLPNSNDCVLVISNDSAHIVAAYYNAESKEWSQYYNCCKYWGELNFVTHWMRLPEPPKDL